LYLGVEASGCKEQKGRAKLDPTMGSPSKKQSEREQKGMNGLEQPYRGLEKRAEKDK
jgi:hypothetical protein